MDGSAFLIWRLARIITGIGVGSGFGIGIAVTLTVIVAGASGLDIIVVGGHSMNFKF